MSEKQFEECTLEEATHVEMGGKTYKIGGSEVKYDSYKSHLKVYKGSDGWQWAHELAFPILGIKPLKEKKREPIEFEFIPSLETAKDMWLPADFIVPMKAVGKKFRCVEILEDEK